MKIFQVALGILAAIGGFVDIGDLVFNTAAGATFGYQLMWVIPIGVIGIIVYSEMCGRVAAVSGKAVFDAVRERVGFTAALGGVSKAIVVEQNHGAQLYRYLRSMIDFECALSSFHRPGPLPLRPGELAEALVAWSRT